MSAYRTAQDPHAPPELVLGFGNLSEQAIKRGIAAIGDRSHRPVSPKRGRELLGPEARGDQIWARFRARPDRCCALASGEISSGA
jgi:hypothetical protein